MVHCAIQHVLKEGENISPMARKKEEPRQSRPGDPVVNTVIINLRNATTTKGARVILKEITGHDYSRDAIYRMYLDGKIEGVRADVANFYYVDSIRKAGQHLLLPKGHKRAGRHAKRKAYPQEIRNQAKELHSQGLSKREVGRRLKVSPQTINNWLQE